MKYISYAVVSLLVAPFLAFAQTQSSALPNAGLTPESPLYFLDKLGENLQRFFTFNPESKARLEITFAKERIAEIKVILEEKGVNAKGLSVAEAGLQDNLSKATTILAQEKQAGKDTSALAKELSDEVSPAQDTLKDTFKSEKNALGTKVDDLKAKITEARQAGDTAQVEVLAQQLADTKAQKELLDQKENDNEDTIDQENEHLDEALGLKEEAAEKIREADEKKTEVLQEAKEQGYDVPAEVLSAFDGLLSQAKAAFDGGNYEEAARLAKEAKQSLKDARKHLEKLQNAKEKEDELKQEADDEQQELEDRLKEADKEEAQKIREEMKLKDELLKEEQEKIKDEQKQIREDLKGTVQQIQRASKMEERMEEEGTPKELKEGNELLPGKELKQLNPTSNEQSGSDQEKMEPISPVEMQKQEPRQ